MNSRSVLERITSRQPRSRASLQRGRDLREDRPLGEGRPEGVALIVGKVAAQRLGHAGESPGEYVPIGRSRRLRLDLAAPARGSGRARPSANPVRRAARARRRCRDSSRRASRSSRTSPISSRLNSSHSFRVDPRVSGRVVPYRRYSPRIRPVMGGRAREEDGVLTKALAVCAVVVTTAAISACGSSSSSSTSAGSGKRHGRHLLEPAADGSIDRPDQADGQRHQARARTGGQQGRRLHGEVHVARRRDRRRPASGTRARRRRTRARPPPDPNAVYYIGEFNSGASEVSIPILNEAGIPQVSPANTYVGLTTNVPGSAPGEPRQVLPDRQPHLPADRPERLDSVGRRPDRDEAGRLHQGRRGQRQGGLRRRARRLCSSWRRAVTGSTSPATPGSTRSAPNFRSYAPTIKGQGADCFFFAGIVVERRGAAHQGRQRGAAERQDLRRRRRLHELYTSAKNGGVPASIAPLMQCTVATLDLNALSGWQGLPGRLPRPSTATRNPDPYAIYGYEVMKLGLDTISGLGADGQRQAEGAQGAVRDQGSPFGSRHLRVRRERRHDAEVVRPVQGRLGRRPGVPQDADADRQLGRIA